MTLIFIFIVFIFASDRIIIDHANSKIHLFKILQFLFSRNQHGHEKRENVHHVNISLYTLFDADTLVITDTLVIKTA